MNDALGEDWGDVDEGAATKPGSMMEVRELPNGCTLFRQENGVGGYSYYSDEIGGGVHVWDTTLVDESTLLAAMTDQAHIRYFAAREETRRQRSRRHDPGQ